MGKKTVSRNEYFELAGKLGVTQTENEYEIAPLDLSKYHLSETTQRITDNNFMEETTDRNGNYMLRGHWLYNLCYQFAEKCKFDLVQIDGYSSYAYSDKQMAIFTYCEGDITLILFENNVDYVEEKTDIIKFYKEMY